MEEPEEIAEDDYAMEEPEEVAEELSNHQQNRFSERDELQPWGNKTKQDAEEMAVKLLAARLELLLFLFFFWLHGFFVAGELFKLTHPLVKSGLSLLRVLNLYGHFG